MTDMITYNSKKIAQELTDTALGKAYYGNALLVAQDIPTLTGSERRVLQRWLNGTQSGFDGFALQALANKLIQESKPEPMSQLQAAYKIGTTGAPHTEAERELFKEYLRGHCWSQGLWDEAKQEYLDYETRVTYAVWRARAAIPTDK